MTDVHPDNTYGDDEIDLRELFVVLWEGKALITIVTGLAAMVSVAVALSMPNIYQSTAILAPKSDGGTGGLSRLASQYGGLANLAGINLGGMGGDGMTKAAIALEKMKSLSFFTKHLYDDVLVDLMAIESWDAEASELIYDEEIYDKRNNKWIRDVDFPYSVKPSPQEAHEEFIELVTTAEDKETGIISVSLEHKSAGIAKRWVELMVSRASEDLRMKDIRDAEESIKFMEAQREKTSLVSLDEVFAQLIEEQTKTIMLANVSKDYVFDVIDPPVAPELKSKPSRVLICVLGTLLGGMLGVVVVLVRHYVRE